MMKKQFIVLILLLLSGIATTIFGDTRKDNIELFVLLDKSLSMVEEIDSVKEYVSNELVDQLLIPGDMFVLINFYGQTDRFFTGEVQTAADFSALKSELKTIAADGFYTDIGAALDTLQRAVDTIPETGGRRRYLLLLTDGKQEAPPESPYYAPDGSFNHKLLEHTKEIARKGWKIHILGIGTDTAAQELARELSAAFSSVSDSADSEEISGTLSSFGTTITAKLLEDRLQTGSETISIPLSLEISFAGKKKPDRETDPITIRIDSLLFTPEGSDEELYLGGTASITIPAGSGGEYETELLVPTLLPESLLTFPAKGEIRFVFSGDHVFQPATLPVILIESSTQEEAAEGFVKRYWFLLVIAALVLVIAVRMILIEIGKKRNEDDDKKRRNLLE